ncbi:hypothetical protein VTK73DRAFT_2685 [Phialemonium thermophilum]|uniref:Uncharacterized protein n=1 Tax=Phialemonium thermophilum TaxID=223376 RepID=A0ABR3VQV1_9PEZI
MSHGGSPTSLGGCPAADARARPYGEGSGLSEPRLLRTSGRPRTRGQERTMRDRAAASIERRHRPGHSTIGIEWSRAASQFGCGLGPLSFGIARLDSEADATRPSRHYISPHRTLDAAFLGLPPNPSLVDSGPEPPNLGSPSTRGHHNWTERLQRQICRAMARHEWKRVATCVFFFFSSTYSLSRRARPSLIAYDSYHVRLF